MQAPALSLPDLPADIIRHILSFLPASDIDRLHLALPTRSTLRAHTRDPVLWSLLYSRDFLAAPPAPRPALRVTRAGTLDWKAAYAEATRRRRAIARQKTNGWGFPAPPTARPQNSPAHQHADITYRFAWAVRLGGALPNTLPNPNTPRQADDAHRS